MRNIITVNDNSDILCSGRYSFWAAISISGSRKSYIPRDVIRVNKYDMDDITTVNGG